MATSALAAVPTVEIFEDWSYNVKYILVNVFHYNSEHGERESKVILRADPHCSYHTDLYLKVLLKILPLHGEMFGAGQFFHSPEDKKMGFYGRPTMFAFNSNEAAAKLAQEAYPEYTVTFDDDECY